MANTLSLFRVLFVCILQFLLLLFFTPQAVSQGDSSMIPLPEGAIARFGLGSVQDVSYSPDGQYLAVATSIGIELRDAGTLEVIRFFSCHNEGVNSIAFSPDSKYLASGLSDKTIRLWDVATGKEIRTLSGGIRTPRSLVFSPDGTLLVSQTELRLALFDVDSGKLVGAAGHDSCTAIPAFCPDGDILACGWEGYGLEAGSIVLWNVESGARIRTLTGHSRSVNSVAFSPDGECLASASSDETIRLWDADSGNVLRTLSGHTNGVRSVAFSPDGKTLASGSYDATMLLWDLAKILHLQEPPHASFTFSSSNPTLLGSVQFTDTSTDPNGQIVSRSWTFGDGAKPTELNPIHQYSESGSFTVTLKITDNDGLTDQATQTAIVAHKDSIKADFTFHVVDEALHKILLDARSSIDTLGTIVRYEWNGDGDGVYDTAVQRPEMIHRFDGEGPYKVILTIVDDQGNRASCTKEVEP